MPCDVADFAGLEMFVILVGEPLPINFAARTIAGLLLH